MSTGRLYYDPGGKMFYKTLVSFMQAISEAFPLSEKDDVDNAITINNTNQLVLWIHYNGDMEPYHLKKEDFNFSPAEFVAHVKAELAKIPHQKEEEEYLVEIFCVKDFFRIIVNRQHETLISSEMIDQIRAGSVILKDRLCVALDIIGLKDKNDVDAMIRRLLKLRGLADQSAGHTIQ